MKILKLIQYGSEGGNQEAEAFIRLDTLSAVCDEHFDPLAHPVLLAALMGGMRRVVNDEGGNGTSESITVSTLKSADGAPKCIKVTFEEVPA